VADMADRNVLEASAVKNLGTKGDVAKLMTIPNFPTTTDPVRLQRVADLLAKYDEIPKIQTPTGIRAELDMHTMVLPPLGPVVGTSAPAGN
jgi:NitT/TauT family transport system substrate-binding protein